MSIAMRLKEAFYNPPREFSVMPFWFWNDALDKSEILRQIADFESHGVYGFVIHPRIGLPQDTGWMSDKLFDFINIALEEAARRGMHVILYDDGMYPSGSSAGDVVKENSNFAERMLDKIDLSSSEKVELAANWNLVAIVKRPNGARVAVVDRPSGTTMRGLHFLDENSTPPLEECPAVADILNPLAVDSFIRHVYDRYYKELGRYFGNTIFAIFTDEPHLSNGTSDILKEVNRILGYDFTPHLTCLWYDDNDDSEYFRDEYRRAIAIRAEETYYTSLSKWCKSHGVALTGHPGKSMDIGMERFFHIPGQDLVWRYVTIEEHSLDGEHSTVAKCASSVMIHQGCRRNSNELYGAYGHELTFQEVKWLANWCFVRGQNLLYPHAFYYSVRGVRRDERPPDVGPNAPWWQNYRSYADACRRLSWLNTDSTHICEIAILGDNQYLPDKSAKVCFQTQRDFNYLELRDLPEVTINSTGLHIAGMCYKAIILEDKPYVSKEFLPFIKKIADAGLLIIFQTSLSTQKNLPNARFTQNSVELSCALDELIVADVNINPHHNDIRYRHIVKADHHFYLLFNEGIEPVSISLNLQCVGKWEWWNAITGEITEAVPEHTVLFSPGEMKILNITA